MNSRADYRSFILSLAWRLLTDNFDLLFVPTIVHADIDDGPCPLARQAREERKDGAYHEAFEVHGHMALQVRDVVHHAVFVDSPVSLYLVPLKRYSA